MRFKTVRKIIICVISSGLAIWGISQRWTYTNILAEPNALNNFQVAEFPEQLIETTLEEMNEILPSSPFIIRATATGRRDYLFKVNQQEVVVQQVYQGEGIQIGSKINIVAGNGLILRDMLDGKLAELGFVNEMEAEKEYLIFLERKVDILGGKNVQDAYYVMQTLITPIFGYEDKENVIITIGEGQPTYVPYEQVSRNEFFVTSQNTLDILTTAKHQFLDLYPKEN